MTENGGAFCSRLGNSWEAALNKKCPVESCNEFLSTGARGPWLLLPSRTGVSFALSTPAGSGRSGGASHLLSHITLS